MYPRVLKHQQNSQRHHSNGSSELDSKQTDSSSLGPWPELDNNALWGLAGDVVRLIKPQSEADPVAILTQFLVAFGNSIGRSAHFSVESDKHHLNLFTVLVGASSKSRKGTSWGHIKRLFACADEKWTTEHIKFGLSSGEGLIWAVRDPIIKLEPIKVKGRVEGYQPVTTDQGVEDKRLLVFESEFASTLRILGREGNILSPVIRCAWDNGDLETLTKNSPAKATGAHISIVGHVTTEELLRYLSLTETANGFGNRFLWICVRRSKVLPEGGLVDESKINSLAGRLKAAIEFAQSCGEVTKDEEAREIWYAIYGELSKGKAGLLGAITGRAEAQVMRLASLYAVLDFSKVIRKEHMLAALAFWDYCAASCRYIFGEAVGDPVADRIMEALMHSPNGMTRTEIYNLLARNCRRHMITGALTLLHESDLAGFETEQTKGRKVERWFALNAGYATNAKRVNGAP